jgi:4-amino-4-deoxy-L-arabinose transferase-like glycosyltransferase
VTAGAADPRRRGALLLLASLAVYAASFALFAPRALQISDETSYVRQALALAHGALRAPALDPETLALRPALPSTYPPGTSLLQAPFVLAFGPRGAALASVAALLAAALLLGRLLWRRGHDPVFALYLLGYLPALVLGRAAMSDVPSALAVTCVLAALFPPQAPGRRALFLAGLCAGLSLLLRESNAVFVLPLCAGVLLRRERGAWALAAGLAAGVAAKLLVTWAFFGDPLYTRPLHAFTAAALLGQAPLYLFALLVLAPGGLLLGLSWRGERRAEVLLTVLLSFALFAAWDYSAEESGGLRRLVLGPRYFLPLLPLLSLAAAERLGPRLAAGPLRAALHACGALVLCAAALVHPLAAAREGAQVAQAAQVCAATAPGAVLVGNTVLVAKVAGDLACPRPLLERARFPTARLAELSRRFPEVDLVLLDRAATAYDRDETLRNEAFLAEAAQRCTLTPALDTGHRTGAGSGGERLRVLRATACK